jgi:hypothetical protein
VLSEGLHEVYIGKSKYRIMRALYDDKHPAGLFETYSLLCRLTRKLQGHFAFASNGFD